MTPFFQGRFINEQIGHQRWRVFEEFSYTNSRGIKTVVEEGFEHDKGSIPQIVQVVIPRTGYWDPACIVHDKQHRDHREGINTTMTRWESNADLLEGCRVMARRWEVPDKQKRHLLIYGGVMAASPEYWETLGERARRLDSLTLPYDVIE